MRSRYTAHVLGDVDYIRESWHSDFRPLNIELEPNIRWVGLDVIEHQGSETKARVEFEARFIVSGRLEAMRENSEFVRENGRWFYTRGETRPPRLEPRKLNRNEPCPCGSGRKFKRCCG